jgi:hypothetical protein
MHVSFRSIYCSLYILIAFVESDWCTCLDCYYLSFFKRVQHQRLSDISHQDAYLAQPNGGN